ncbi:hypothetical protein [Planomicrobium sp. CPCC 101110]|uniref:hypothetical protein n=1 Tax=Planomicrobium sp. CPCC 101110 TaxID=2599619 RepID=UPI001647EB8C|nr:hypothetical protein [Planomicrobium sp. CPCC 101110]
MKNLLSIILILLGVLLALSLLEIINIPLSIVYVAIFVVAIVLLMLMFFRDGKTKNT